MSHDQSPARVRVVSSRDATPARRRQDVAPTIIDAAAAASTRAPTAEPSHRARMALVLLFLVACALAGVAVARRLA